MINFLMVIMASGIACGHVRMKTELTKMVIILQLIGWQLSDMQPWLPRSMAIFPKLAMKGTLPLYNISFESH